MTNPLCGNCEHAKAAHISGVGMCETIPPCGCEEYVPQDEADRVCGTCGHVPHDRHCEVWIPGLSGGVVCGCTERSLDLAPEAPQPTPAALRSPQPTTPMPDHLAKYVEYIRNTKRVPLPVALFDDDWEPIGPMVRRDLVAAGLIVESPDGITVTTNA